MVNQAKRLVLSAVLVFAVAVGSVLCLPPVAAPVAAMDARPGHGFTESMTEGMTEMVDWELGMITAGRYRFYTEGPPELPESLQPVHVPAMTLETLGQKDARFFFGDASRSPVVTVQGLNATLWTMQEAVTGVDRAPVNLWLVIDTFKVPRTYFDVGHDLHGWEFADRDYSKRLRGELNAMNLTGVDGKPLTVDQIVHQITYDPKPRERTVLREETYFLGDTFQGYRSTTRVEECFYRRGYWIVFQY